MIRMSIGLSGVFWKAALDPIFAPVIESALAVAGDLCVASVAELVTQRAANTGLLSQSIRRTAVGRPAPGVWSTDVFSPLAYAEVVEFGRRAGAKFPPPDPIILWVRRKLGLSSGQARGVAFVVARAIARRGIPGKWVFRDGLARVEGRISQLFEQVAAQIAARLSA